MKKEIIPENIIVNIIVNRSKEVSISISFCIATADPVLVLSIV